MFKKLTKKIDKNIDLAVNGPAKHKIAIAIWIVVALMLALFVFE
jgi:hypothetical protein